jgi:hypothetical protein
MKTAIWTAAVVVGLVRAEAPKPLSLDSLGKYQEKWDAQDRDARSNLRAVEKAEQAQAAELKALLGRPVDGVGRIVEIRNEDKIRRTEGRTVVEMKKVVLVLRPQDDPRGDFSNVRLRCTPADMNDPILSKLAVGQVVRIKGVVVDDPGKALGHVLGVGNAAVTPP